MGIFCVDCEATIDGDLNAFERHMRGRQHNAPFKCSEGDCVRRAFAYRSSLFRHIREHHSDIHSDIREGQEEDIFFQDIASETDSDSEVLPLDDNQDEVVDDQDEPNIDLEIIQPVAPPEVADVDVNSEKEAALLILNLKKSGTITGTGISTIVQETQNLLKNTVLNIQHQTRNKMRAHGLSEETIEECLSDIEVNDPFAKLKSKEQQLKYFEKNFFLVRPEPQFVKYIYAQRLDQGTQTVEETQVSKTYQSISLIKILTVLLNIPAIFNMIQEEKVSTDGAWRSYLDGSMCQENTLIRKYPNILRIVLYSDEFDVANDLGAKRKIHKIMGVMFLVQKLPPEENSRLRSIHATALGYSKLLDPQAGVDSVLEAFFDDLQKLESDEGVVITVQGEPFTLRATLIGVAGDALAAHDLMGLMSCSAKFFCRRCMVTKDELHENILAMGEPRTEALYEEQINDIVTNGDEARRRTGLKRYPLIRRHARFARHPKYALFDCMHDLLRGIVSMEIKLALRELILVLKLFTVDLFNARIESFHYGFLDMKSKPSATFSLNSLRNISSYTLAQSAAQTWCLLRAIPFLVGDKVPANNSHLKLLVLLKRICDIAFSTTVTETMVTELEALIKEHHILFSTLYPSHETEDDAEEEDDDVEVAEEPAEEAQALQDHDIPGPSAQRREKRKKKIRPIPKHHYLLHYPEMIREFGPAVLYWCMRFEGKHAICKRYGSICCNFKNLPLTLADMHQTNQAAELYQFSTSVRDERQVQKGVFLAAGDSQHHEALTAIGIHHDTVLKQVNCACAGGFEFRPGYFVVLPILIHGLPVFASICSVYVNDNDDIILVSEKFKTVEYDVNYAAYVVEKLDSPFF